MNFKNLNRSLRRNVILAVENDMGGYSFVRKVKSSKPLAINKRKNGKYSISSRKRLIGI